jgi:hypothetical protein
MILNKYRSIRRRRRNKIKFSNSAIFVRICLQLQEATLAVAKEIFSYINKKKSRATCEEC